MKIIKGVLYTLLALLVIYLILIPFGKSGSHVERTLVMNADAKTIYDNIVDLKTWKQWSYWDMLDSAMKSTYEGSGVGATHRWESDHPDVGTGSITVTKAEEGKWVEFELVFGGMGGNMGGWKMKDTTGGVAVTTYMDMKCPWYFRPMTLFFNPEKMMGPPFETSLANLKTLSESQKAPASNETRIEEGTMEATKVLTILDSCNGMKEIGPKLGALYGEIGTAATKAGAKQAGNVFAIYHKVVLMDNGDMKFVLEAGVPVDKEMKTDGRVKYWVMPAGNVVKGMHYGKYEATDKTHAILHEWISNYGKQIAGSPWEVYVTDPMMEKDTAKWLTEIYYPIK